MMDIPLACVELTSAPQIVFKEKKAKISFLNNGHNAYRRIKVDGCVLKEGNKCDFLLVSDEYGDQYFIELKGEDLNHAVTQLETSIDKLIDKRDGLVHKAFLVSSNSGMKINTRRQVIEKRFKNKGVELFFFHSQSKYKLER